MKKEGNIRKGLIFTILIVLLTTSIMSMASSLSVEKTSSRKTSIALKTLTGPAPEINQKNLISTAGKANNLDNIDRYMLSVRGTTMYAYNVNASGLTSGPCYFDTEDPGTVTKLSNETVTNFLSGGTWTYAGFWYACQYSTGLIYTVTPDTGEIVLLGGGGNNLNALAYHGQTNTLWGAGDTNLFSIDLDTGAQTVVAPFSGNGGNIIIGMAFDGTGTLYGWDVKFNGSSYLYKIDIVTAECTQFGNFGVTLCYAQDGDFDRENGNILYLTAFTIAPNYGGYLYSYNICTGTCTLIGAFQGSAELDASMIQSCFCDYHDVGVKDIISPNNGYANQDMEVIVKVKNYGENSEENVPVNVVILKDGVDEEYNETMYVDIGYGETLDLEMLPWTPSDWQSVSNEYIDYKITAYTKLCGDDNSSNDYKEKWFELYFGYFHDVGCTNVIRPESGPAQTFPINVTIKNLGQYDECCFKTYVEIAEIDIENQVELLSQNFSDYLWPPDGWAVNNSKWQLVNSSHAGGAIPEARFGWYPAETGLFRLFTPAIDTGDYSAVEIEFKHSINHYSSPYTLKVETSSDGVNWSTVWEIVNPSSQGSKTESIVTNANVGSDNFYISWTFEGKSYNFWYVDDIVIKGYTSFDPEYEDYQCTTTIEPGEETELEFDDWTPGYLAEETSGTKIYSVKAWTDLNDPQDENPNNDLFSKILELDFFHDVGIKEVTSPNIYIRPGNQNINVIIENIGTFPEQDMTCYAEIYEYITNCTNGTLVYEDNITNIDIEQPLGGTETLIFDDYNFTTEGVCCLDLNLVDENDNYPDNNQMTYVIGADGTPPTSTHILNPAIPNGNNSWYVSNVTVTLNATDPSIGCDNNGSGVKEIKYTINGVPDSIPGDTGTFIIHNDGTNIEVKYWSIDMVGNTEAKHTFYINMDQTKPIVPEGIAYSAEKVGSNWFVTLNVSCSDVTSKMNRVEWAINDVVYNITTGPGPIYNWTIEWCYIPEPLTFKAIAYDKAGNSDFVTINGSDIKSHPIGQSSQQSTNNQNLLGNLLLKHMVKTTRTNK